MTADRPLPDSRQRRVRSFVRRTGRITPAQESALRRLWPRFGLERGDGPLDLDAVFGRRAPRVLEIGFGNGDALLAQAAANPGQDYLGIEVHEPGLGHCLLGIESQGTDNLRLIRHDALDVLAEQIADDALARINLYFPDPWPKKRHHKRRLVNDAFVALAAQKLQRGGLLCVATDWVQYAEHIDAVLARAPRFALLERREHGGERPLDRATTRFERRGLAQGHRIRDWQFARR